MVRTWSANPGRRMRWIRRTAPVWIILLAHLGLLSMLLEQRATAPTVVGQDTTTASFWTGLTADPATLAIVSGLLLGLLLISSSRNQAAPVDSEHSNPTKPLRSAYASTASAQPIQAATCTSQDAYASLMARIGHDLRTPLNALLGFSDLMKSETFGPLGDARYRAYAADMHSCGLDLLRATESTLAMTALLANPSTCDRAIVCLIDLVAEAWATASLQRGGQACNLNAAITPDLTVRGDLAGCHQGLVHLMSAARLRAAPGADIDVSAIGSHGRVQLRVSTRTTPQHREIANTGCRSGSSAYGTVDDLPLSLSRTILGLQGLLLQHGLEPNGRWTATIDLEAAGQTDFFASPAASRPARTLVSVIAVAPSHDHSGAFLGGAVSLSRSTGI